MALLSVSIGAKIDIFSNGGVPFARAMDTVNTGPLGVALHFGADVVHGNVQDWHLEQIRPFLENPDSLGPLMAARYYGKVSRQRDLALWQHYRLEYGILEISPGILSAEWMTFPGHRHKGPGRTPLAAVMEVVHGEAGLYLQPPGSHRREANIVWLRTGHRVFLPPGQAHAIINRGRSSLIVSEVHSSLTEADFTEAAKHRGMAYYFGPTGARPNPHYRDMVSLRKMTIDQMATPDTSGEDLYQAVTHHVDRFRFLHPF